MAAAFGAGATGMPAPAAASFQAATPQAGGVLKVGVQGDPVGLDPHISILDAADIVVDWVYEGLVRLAPDLTPLPALAESWDISEDGLVYRFALRPNVTFHNGRAVEAADVRYSLERVMNPDTGSPDVTHVTGIAGIETPDPATVVITLNAPDASFLTRVARTGLGIVPREVVEANGDLQQVMVGTGPFMLEEYVPNTHLIFRRNDAYWDQGLPLVDQMDVLIIPNDTTRTTALTTGTVDLIEMVPQKDIALMEGDENLKLAGGVVANLRWIVFNLQREPFGNLALRQAIAQGIDRQPIIDAAVFGYGEPLRGLYPAAFWFGYQGEIPAPDLAGANAAIAALDLPDDFRPKILTFADYEFLSNTSIVVQEQLRLMGIDSEIDPQETATYLDNLFSGNFDIAVMGAAGYTDPAEFLTSMLGTGEYTNPGKYSNPELDELLRQGLSTQNREERAAIYQQAQEIVIADVPVIPLYTSNTYEGLRVDVEGFEHSLTGRLTSLRSTWLNR
jgi:peptide/nickel transport system substrate-binding protein